MRAKLRGLKRNAAVVLGNAGNEEDVPTLAVLSEDEDEMLAEHARWAIARISARNSN
jgi:epoxyqueuosine reductase